MRNSGILILGAVVFGFSMAQANETSLGKSDAYKIQCHFKGSFDKKKGDLHCYSHGSIARYSIAPSSSFSIQEEQDSKLPDQLTVKCGGLETFSGGVYHTSKGGFEYLGTVNPSTEPSIKYPSNQPAKDAFIVSSWLSYAGGVAEGYCAFENLVR